MNKKPELIWHKWRVRFEYCKTARLGNLDDFRKKYMCEWPKK